MWSSPLFGDRETAARIERAEAANHQAFVDAMRTRSGGEIAATLEVGGGLAAFAGVGSPLTQAFGLGLDGPVDESELDRLFDFYESRGAETAVEVCNLADASLPNALVARGCRIDEHTHVLARRLDDVAPVTDGDSLHLVRREELEQWTEVVTRGFTEGTVAPELRVLLEIFYAQANSECVWASREGKMVAGGCVFFVDDIAILGGASTLPEQRGRGAQRDLIRFRLELAKARGASVAVVSTAPGTVSQKNVLRAGFSVLYARTKYVGSSPGPSPLE